MDLKVIELDGRRFVPYFKTSMAHGDWFIPLAMAAGVDKVEIIPDEPVEAYAERMLRAVWPSGKLLDLLGGLLLPEGLDPREWTPAVAADIAKHLRQLVEPDDKEKAHRLLGDMLAGFFRSGSASLKTSPTSSPLTPPAGAEGGFPGTSTDAPASSSASGH